MARDRSLQTVARTGGAGFPPQTARAFAGDANVRARSWQDMEALEVKDAFLAVTALKDDRPTVVAGFRLKAARSARKR